MVGGERQCGKGHCGWVGGWVRIFVIVRLALSLSVPALESATCRDCRPSAVAGSVWVRRDEWDGVHLS